MIHNLTLTLLEKPGSESWVLLEFVRIYALACHRLEDKAHRDVCLKGAKQTEPVLFNTIINGDVSCLRVFLLVERKLAHLQDEANLSLIFCIPRKFFLVPS
jgi:hypothetical protein